MEDVSECRRAISFPLKSSNPPLPPLPAIPRGSLVIVEGRAPIWRYGMALHRLHGSPAAAVAFYDPRLGAVVVATHSREWPVVATHSREWPVGQVVDVPLSVSGDSLSRLK
ncbi:MAG: CRISPR-associated protein Csx3 [Methanothrix sp.]